LTALVDATLLLAVVDGPTITVAKVFLSATDASRSACKSAPEAPCPIVE
jgi:hypothetical protein